MCPLPYIQVEHVTQLLKSLLTHQNQDIGDPYLYYILYAYIERKKVHRKIV
jgi:hypothetical protein